MRLVLLGLLLVALNVLAGGVSAMADETLYGRKIVIVSGDAPTKLLQPAISDLRETLGKMTGEQFDIAPTTDGPAIVLSLTQSPAAPADAVAQLKGRGIQPFWIGGTPARLDIVANDVHGLSNGIYFYLESLGVRWLLPGDNWTEIPQRRDIGYAGAQLIAPAYLSRSYAGTGGFFSSLWGRRYSGSKVLEDATLAWQRRMRFGNEFPLGHAMGEGFIADPKITPILAAHPDYLAIVGGKPSPLYIKGADGKQKLNIIAKVNAGNPQAVALFCNWVLEDFRRKRAGIDASTYSAASVEPSDGYGYGDNVDQLPGDGSGSDQTFYIANQCAKTIRAVYPDASVILLAYAGHAKPPSFALEPNVIVQITPYAFQDDTPENFIAQWRKTGARLAIYDYWSIPDWLYEQPAFDYLGISKKLKYWHDNGIVGLNAESTYGAGAMGLGLYMAAHQMWDLDLDSRPLADDWYKYAFGPAQAPMKRMLERWAKSYRPISAEYAQSYADIAEAVGLAGNDAKLLSRIDDYAAYLHYLRLQWEYLQATGEPGRLAAVERLANYVLSINDRLMVATTRIVDLEGRLYPRLTEIYSLADKNNPGPGWKDVHPLDHDAIQALVAEGRALFKPGDWQVKSFSGAWVPVPNTGASTITKSVMTAVGDFDADIVVAAGGQTLSLRMAGPMTKDFQVFDDAGNSVYATKAEAGPKTGDDVWQTVAVALPAGHFRIHVHPTGGRGSGHFKFETPEGMPFSMRYIRSPKIAPSPPLYFYVPRGLRKLALFLPHGDFKGTFKMQVTSPDGKAVPLEFSDLGHVAELAVPQGMDGRVWSIRNVVSPDFPVQLLNAPQAFALSPAALLVPADAL